MSRIIITNRTSMRDADAVVFVADVIRAGRISGDAKSYCYVTTFPPIVTLHPFTVVVYATRRNSSDSFVVRERVTPAKAKGGTP
jgi:hypothetical protein